MEPHISASNQTRPYVLSVEADIPEGTAIVVAVNGENPDGTLRTDIFTNPVREPLKGVSLDTFSVELRPAPNSFAVPFLYALTVEGDGKKMSFTAEMLAATRPMAETGEVLMRPEGGRPYLTRTWLANAEVFASDVSRPYVLEVEGGAGNGTKLSVTFLAMEPDGSTWEQEVVGPGRTELKTTTFKSFQWRVTMEPSPDRLATPYLTGIAIAGDNRRFLLSGRNLMG